MSATADRNVNHALRARFDEVYADYRRLRSGLDELQRSLRELRVTERSDDGQVVVTVDARGQVVEIELAPAVLGATDASALSRKITNTVHRATAAGTARSRQAVAEYLPHGSGAPEFLSSGDFGDLLGRADAVFERKER